MYLSYYQLKSKPFQIASDPRFLWPGEKHKEALAVLKYGILDDRGFVMLTGDVGTGKTTLIHSLLADLEEDVIFAPVPDPGLEKIALFNFVADGFQMNRWFNSKGEFLVYFSRFLHNAFDEQKRVLLIIDEAQRMKPELLEEVRVLSNFEKASAKLINIFFVGQNEFNDMLLRKENRALRQRITINYQLEPLLKEELSDYILHRLRVAGAKDDRLFTSGAIDEIFRFTRGYPRKINVLCDHALLTGFTKEIRVIDEKIIYECVQDLSLPMPKKQEVRQRPAERVHPEEVIPVAVRKKVTQTHETAKLQTVSQPAQHRSEMRESKPVQRIYSVLALLLLLMAGGFLFHFGLFGKSAHLVQSLWKDVVARVWAKPEGKLTIYYPIRDTRGRRTEER